MKLANGAFGEFEAPIVFGWVVAGHQLGAAVAAFGAGVIREQDGTYSPAFVIAGVAGLVAAAAFLPPLGREGAALRSRPDFSEPCGRDCGFDAETV